MYQSYVIIIISLNLSNAQNPPCKFCVFLFRKGFVILGKRILLVYHQYVKGSAIFIEWICQGEVEWFFHASRFGDLSISYSEKSFKNRYFPINQIHFITFPFKMNHPLKCYFSPRKELFSVLCNPTATYHFVWPFLRYHCLLINQKYVLYFTKFVVQPL